MDVCCMGSNENRKQEQQQHQQQQQQQEQPLANDFSYAYPLMRDDFGSNVPLKTSTISVGNNSNCENFITKSPKAPPKRKSKSLKQLHFRDSKNHENMLNGQCNSQVPIAPKRTKSRTSILLASKLDMNQERDGREWNRNQLRTVPLALTTSNYSIVQKPMFRVRKMHHTAKFLRNVPRSTLSLAIPERPIRSLSSAGSRLHFQLQNSRRSASYAEIPDAVQLRPLPAPPRPPRKSKDTFAFMDDNQNQSQTLSSGIWMNGNSNSLSASSGSNKDLKSDKEIRHGSLATPETNSIKDFANSMTNQLLEQKKETTIITSRPIPVAVEKLHVIHLDVDQLRIGELRADKLSVNESSTNDLQANHLQTQTGQLRLNQLDFSQEVIQEIVRLLAYSIGQVRNDTAAASEAMGSSEPSSSGNGDHINRNGLLHSQSLPHDPSHSSDTDATAILSSSSLSDPVSPNRSEPLLPPPSPPNNRSLQSFRCPIPNPNRTKRPSTAQATLSRSLAEPPTTKTLNDDPLTTIANLTIDLIREIVTIAYSIIYHLYVTISDAFDRRSVSEQNALLLIVAVIAGVIAVVLSTWVSSNRTPAVLHHHWQYYSPPSGDI